MIFIIVPYCLKECNFYYLIDKCRGLISSPTGIVDTLEIRESGFRITPNTTTHNNIIWLCWSRPYIVKIESLVYMKNVAMDIGVFGGDVNA
jgi:hypothetical protein